MSIWRLVLKEILHRKLNSALALVSVAVAVGCFVGAKTLLVGHEVHTQQIVEAKQAETQKHMADLEDAMRRAMLNLGFNIVILSKDQTLEEWHTKDSTTQYIPEEYVDQLKHSKIVTVQHLLPVLQEKVKWPERKRSIILVGTRGEIPSPGTKKPMVSPVPPGTIVLGNELAESLDLKVGDKVPLMGREFTVRQCYPMRGNKDDITAWIDLAQAQEMLERKGKLSAILALECGCAQADLPLVREEITRVLPGTQVIERGSEALARAEARRKVGEEAEASIQREKDHRGQLKAAREQFAGILVPVVMLAAAVWIALLALSNVRDRRGEIGILRAIGVRGRQIMLLFLSKAALTGLLGGAIGCLAGWLAGWWLTGRLESGAIEGMSAAALWKPAYALVAVAVAPVLSAAAAWVPAISAAQQDPAVVLREE